MPACLRTYHTCLRLSAKQAGQASRGRQAHRQALPGRKGETSLLVIIPKGKASGITWRLFTGNAWSESDHFCSREYGGGSLNCTPASSCSLIHWNTSFRPSSRPSSRCLRRISARTPNMASPPARITNAPVTDNTTMDSSVLISLFHKPELTWMDRIDRIKTK